MTINWEKLKRYRESQRPGVGKTFSMLVGAVEYIRDNPGKDVLIIGTSTPVLARMKETVKGIAVELHVKIESEFDNTLVLNESHVLFLTKGLAKGVGRDRIFVDHAALESIILEHKSLSQK